MLDGITRVEALLPCQLLPPRPLIDDGQGVKTKVRNDAPSHFPLSTSALVKSPSGFCS
jgi:hypothetical protein